MDVKEAISDRLQTVRNDASRLDSILSKRESPNFEIDELCQLGIHPVQVELTEADVLKFEPCFFRPSFPPSLLSDYPIREDDEDNEILRSSPDPDSESESDGEPSPIEDAFSTNRYVNLQCHATRDGFDGGLTAFYELGTLDSGCVYRPNFFQLIRI
jgi:hypothetical protein